MKDRSTKWDVSFSIEVGDQEKHQVEFRWAQWNASARFFVDGAEVFHEKHLMGLKISRKYEITVGDREPHAVAVVKKRPIPSSALRKQAFSAFVDDHLVGEY